jgi:crossover junction endodeoxyribonuclease RuvC
VRIIGFDPGLAIVGYGVLESDGRVHRVIDYGVINTPKTERTPVRLALIQKGVMELFEKFKPDIVAIEELFFAKNVTTAINVAQARGVILAESIRHVGLLYEYTPLQVKQALTGYGKADKNQIQQMVKLLLRLNEIPKPDDAADALAVALTHANTSISAMSFEIK